MKETTTLKNLARRNIGRFPANQIIDKLCEELSELAEAIENYASWYVALELYDVIFALLMINYYGSQISDTDLSEYNKLKPKIKRLIRDGLKSSKLHLNTIIKYGNLKYTFRFNLLQSCYQDWDLVKLRYSIRSLKYTNEFEMLIQNENNKEFTVLKPNFDF